MPELTPSADRYISTLLARAGCVVPEALDWVPEHERADVLHQYFIAHCDQSGLRYADGVLSADRAVGSDESSAQEVFAPPKPVTVTAAAGASTPPVPAPTAPAETPTAPMTPSPYPPAGGYGYMSGGGFPADGYAGKALLDSKPATPPVAPWIWFLPLMLGLLGGIVGWLIVRDDNPRGGRNVLIAGVVVSVLSFCATMAVMGSLAPAMTGARSVSWPTTGQATARPAMYYFGTST